VARRPGRRLNPALEHGADAARRHGAGVVTSPRTCRAAPQDLAAASRGARGGRAFVADSAGTGTTLLAAASPAALSPSYGPGSRARHLDGGAVELTGPPALRRDVDTPDDLRDALRLGVGTRTAAVAAHCRRSPDGCTMVR
jgi:2-phospho-L-lactate guanylyltransferase